MSEHKKMNTAKNTLPQKMNLLPIILEVVAEQTENFDFRGEVFLTSFVDLKCNSIIAVPSIFSRADALAFLSKRMTLITQLKNFYEWAESVSDPRVQDWIFIKSPIPTYSLCFLYILFACKFGPMLMKNREPFQLKWTLVIYNGLLTTLNLHIFLELFFGMINANYSWPCQPVKSDGDLTELRIAAALWWYFVSKLIEFLDTVFFVLRKKNNQLTFLHIYHHSTMPMIWWICAKWVPGGSSVHGAVMNAFVHVIMYFYYGMSALGPQYQKYLWWKKYLTQIQLIQFTIALILCSYVLYLDCDYPRFISWIVILYMISFLFLFGNFYLKAYTKPTSSKIETSRSAYGKQQADTDSQRKSVRLRAKISN